MARQRLAVDVGGTFIDFMLLDEGASGVRTEKVPAAQPLEARFMEGIDRLGIDLRELDMIIHGSTVVINTIVQETGARVGLITTRGFRDVYELGRGNRAEIYNLFYRPPAPLVPRYLRFEVSERMSARGEALEPLDVTEARSVVRRLHAEGVDGIAIAFLHAYANPAHEQQMAAIVAEECPDLAVTASSEITREWREFERTSTAVLNVYTKPRMVAYLSALERDLGSRHYSGTLSIMQSSGGMTSSTIARELPIRTLESGPAGGVIGASSLGRALSLPSLVAADVGGTTFDVALIIDGEPFEKAETRVNRRPVLQPTLDIVSIGAGGGSIAWLDGEGSLRVGPRSAQAVPGPACFGQGGSEPTVTDAQVVLGYLDPDYFLGNRMQLDRAAGETVIREKIAEPLHLDLIPAAQGIYHLAAMNMTYAIRNITIERGHDPREFTLVCFGGGGGLFAGHLLNELECASAIIPVNPANFSGWGLLNADYRQDLTRMFRASLSDVDPIELGEAFSALQTEAVATLVQNRIDTASLACQYYAHLRYVGQEHTVRAPIYAAELNREGLSAVRQRFDMLHEQAYAHMLPDHAVEIVRLQLVALAGTARPDFLPLGVRQDFEPKGMRQIYVDTSGNPVNCLIADRETLPAGTNIDGPVIVEEWSSTTLALPRQRLHVDPYGNLIITRI